MKLNKITMMLAAAALASCSNDLNEQLTAQAPQDSRLIELDANFMIAGVGAEDATTRTHWEQDAETKALLNKFLPVYGTTAPSSGANLGEGAFATPATVVLQKVGLCWYQGGGSDVYTNYEFYHFGWLNNDETEVKASCGKVYNGALYSDLALNTTVSAEKEAKPTDFNYASGSGTPSDDLNFNSGIYMTDNATIFKGEYIVYYPYNEDFKETGTIPAIAETVINYSDDFKSKELGKSTFRYSDPYEIDGGAQAAGFKMNNLSTLVQLRVAADVVGDAFDGQYIDQIVLYSPSGKLVKQANLDASKIAAGKKGAELYAKTVGTNTIVVNCNYGTGYAVAAKTAASVPSSYITVLPTTVPDLQILVHNVDNDTWAHVSKPNTVFEAGSAKRIDVNLTNADFKTEYIAVDFNSLAAAVTAIGTNEGTIEVLGDIVIDNSGSGLTINNENLTITGCDIIVPQDEELKINCIMESNVRVLGTDCCNGTYGGKLTVNDGGKISNVTLEPTEHYINSELDYNNYNPTLTYAAGATVLAGNTVEVQAGNVVVSATNGNVAHKGNLVVAEGAKVTVEAAGVLNFIESEILNNGTIEIKKQSLFDITNEDGSSVGTDGQRMTNNGTFIHNVDAAAGTAVQNMKQNGEYRCRVDEQNKLDDAYSQWTACNVIEMVNSTAYTYDLVNACNHAGKPIDIIVNATSGKTTFDNPTDGNKGDKLDINIGNLTVKSELDVVFVGTVSPNNKRTLIVNGDMNVEGASATLTNSAAITITNDLNVAGEAGTETLTYKAANGKLEVKNNITVNKAIFDADETNAVNITCANFTLENAATAKFGNRTSSTSAVKNMFVSGTITNSKGCTLELKQGGTGILLAWVRCNKLINQGSLPYGQPKTFD